jgi:hypothetical protein
VVVAAYGLVETPELPFFVVVVPAVLVASLVVVVCDVVGVDAGRTTWAAGVGGGRVPFAASW